MNLETLAANVTTRADTEQAAKIQREIEAGVLTFRKALGAGGDSYAFPVDGRVADVVVSFQTLQDEKRCESRWQGSRCQGYKHHAGTHSFMLSWADPKT